MALPNHWRRISTTIDRWSIPEQPETAIHLIGCGPDDEAHALYELPIGTSHRDILVYFEVGALDFRYSDGTHQADGILLFIEQLTKLAPATPFFADAAGYKLWFDQPPESAVVNQLAEEAGDIVHNSLEAMLGDDGDVGRTLEETKVFHFWWD